MGKFIYWPPSSSTSTLVRIYFKVGCDRIPILCSLPLASCVCRVSFDGHSIRIARLLRPNVRHRTTTNVRCDVCPSNWKVICGFRFVLYLPCPCFQIYLFVHSTLDDVYCRYVVVASCTFTWSSLNRMYLNPELIPSQMNIARRM